MWSYPGVDGGLRDLLMKKCNLDQEDQEEEEEGKETAVLQFSFGHYSKIWYYLSNFRADQCETLPKVDIHTSTLLKSSAKLGKICLCVRLGE